MAGLRGERLWRLSFNAGGAVTGREPLLQGQYGRLRHVAQAPDGSLWVLTSNRDGRGNPTSDDDRILHLTSLEKATATTQAMGQVIASQSKTPVPLPFSAPSQAIHSAISYKESMLAMGGCGRSPATLIPSLIPP